MDEEQLQEERLDLLLEALKEEEKGYSIEVPSHREGKERLLRTLMNLRRPKPLDPEILQVQDAYLQSLAKEKGIVELSDIASGGPGISLWQGDITRLRVDGIVNAANAAMLGCFIPMHGCIDNQIHTYAGMQLREECDEKMKKLRREYGENYVQPTATPMFTKAYNLPSKFIIHIVGPIVHPRLTAQHEKELKDCYWNVLQMCKEKGLQSIAFCCISTGEFHFPNRRAAQIATATVDQWLQANPRGLDRIIFNVFKDEDRGYYEELLRERSWI